MRASSTEGKKLKRVVVALLAITVPQIISVTMTVACLFILGGGHTLPTHLHRNQAGPILVQAEPILKRL